MSFTGAGTHKQTTMEATTTATATMLVGAALGQ